MPLVSVVVPVYNAQKYIKRCLDSIKSQDFDDFEVIMVDDGSTDSSADLCKAFCEDDSRFRLIGQKNQGPDMARKSGTTEAKGKYIMYVDADDYISAEYIGSHVKAAEEYNADLVCSQIVRFDGNRQWDGSIYKDEVLIYEDTRKAMNAYFGDEYLKGTYYAKLIDAKLMKDYGFVKDTVIGEDITAALYMIANAKKIAVIPEKHYYYYWNTGSISHSGYTKRHRQSLKNYIRVRDEILAGRYVEDKIVCGYFAEYEMAVATAMSRSWTYDKEAGELLKSDIRQYWKQTRSNKKTAMYMKICMRIYMTSPKLFMFLYRIIYLVTGR